MIEFFIILLRSARSIVSAWRRDPQFRSLVFLVVITLLGGTIFYSTVEGWSIVIRVWSTRKTKPRAGVEHHSVHGSPETAATKRGLLQCDREETPIIIDSFINFVGSPKHPIPMIG